LDGGAWHARFGTSRGPIHLYRPAGFAPRTAGTIVYLHGFYTDVDNAWTEYHLADQFEASDQNALFIVPETTSGRTDDIWWKDLDELLGEIREHAMQKVPPGQVVVAGHSGAYRNIACWLDAKRLVEVVLIDGLYGNDDDFAGWV